MLICENEMIEKIKLQIINQLEKPAEKTIPIECFLNRVFPVSTYKEKTQEIIVNRIFQPRRDCSPYHITLPLDWEADWSKEDRNWRMQLQGLVMFHPVMNFFDAYEDKNAVVAYFFEVIQDWLLIYGDDPNDIVTTRMPTSYAWYDMSVGFRALVVAFFIDRISHFKLQISDEQINCLAEITKKHISHLYYEPAFSLNNHGMFQIQGLMALIQLLGVDDYSDEYTYALDKMEKLVLSQYNEQGIHLEHSPHYHFYALTTFDNVVKSGWYASKKSIPKTVLMAHGKKKWIVDPLNRPACIGDSILTVQKGISFDKCDGDNYLEVAKQGQNYVISDFNDSGYAIIRSHWDTPPDKATYVFFMGMYQSKTHKHRDCLSFEWFDAGDKILCDGGKYGYKSDKYRHFFLSNRAHNTVEIEGFDILKIKPYGSSIVKSEYKDEVFVVEGKLDYPAISFGRQLYINPGKWLIIKDDLSFKKARNATQWQHLAPGYNLVSSKNNYLKFNKAGDKNLIVHCLAENVSTSIYSGDDEYMQGFISQKDYVFEAATAIGFDFFGDEKEVITILALNDDSYQLALDFIKFKELVAIPEISKNLKLTQPKNLIRNIKHTSCSDIQQFQFIFGKGTYSLTSKENNFDFYMDLKESKKLVIMLPGATNRTKSIKNFQRYSWTDDFNCSVVSFIDPTINEYNDLSIGWYQGTKNNYLVPKLAQVIKELINKLDINEKDVLLFGSSAGGFTSLQLANYFLQATIIVINPQVYLNHYTHTHFERLLNYSYKGVKEADVLEQYKDRISVDIDLAARQSPVIYYQNTCDEKHLNLHLKPLISSLEKADVNEMEWENVQDVKQSNFNVIYYADSISGHSPPDKKITIEMINYAFKI